MAILNDFFFCYGKLLTAEKVLLEITNQTKSLQSLAPGFSSFHFLE